MSTKHMETISSHPNDGRVLQACILRKKISNKIYGKAARLCTNFGPRDRKFLFRNKIIDSLFEGYKNKKTGIIDPQGIQALFADLGVNQTDNITLRLSWKMKVAKQGYITLEEWQRGLITMKVFTLNGLRRAVAALDNEVLTETELQALYEYAFQYSVIRHRQKFIDLECAYKWLELVLQSYYSPQVDSLIKYLKVQKDYKMISFDQWRGFFEFFRTISFPDFSNHDAYDAWPVILDDYVVWMNEAIASEAVELLNLV